MGDMMGEGGTSARVRPCVRLIPFNDTPVVSPAHACARGPGEGRDALALERAVWHVVDSERHETMSMRGGEDARTLTVLAYTETARVERGCGCG